jgi:hypothetical protein
MQTRVSLKSVDYRHEKEKEAAFRPYYDRVIFMDLKDDPRMVGYGK